MRRPGRAPVETYCVFTFAPVAQLDRAPHYECGGPRFESWQGHWSACPRGIRRPTDVRALATPPDLGSGVTAFDSRMSDSTLPVGPVARTPRFGRGDRGSNPRRAAQGGLAEPGKATVLKTVVGVRAPRRFESCILRQFQPSWSNGYDAGVRSRERRFDSCRGHCDRSRSRRGPGLWLQALAGASPVGHPTRSTSRQVAHAAIEVPPTQVCALDSDVLRLGGLNALGGAHKSRCGDRGNQMVRCHRPRVTRP